MKDNYDNLRNTMVKEQLADRGIRDKLVLSAFQKVPRHRFVPEDSIEDSYCDYPLQIGYDQTISQPYMVALMTESLALSGGERILEVGTGSGYQTAILAEIVKEVYSIERVSELAERAKQTFDELGYKNIHIKVADGTLGWEECAPYDGIIVTAGAPDVPEPLLRQLKNPGRVVVPIGTNFGQMLQLVSKLNGRVESKNICYCVFVPLIGRYGWSER